MANISRPGRRRSAPPVGYSESNPQGAELIDPNSTGKDEVSVTWESAGAADTPEKVLLLTHLDEARRERDVLQKRLDQELQRNHELEEAVGSKWPHLKDLRRSPSKHDDDADAKRLRADLRNALERHEALLAKLGAEHVRRTQAETQLKKVTGSLAELESISSENGKLRADLASLRRRTADLEAYVKSHQSNEQDLEATKQANEDLRTSLAAERRQRELAEQELADLTTLSRWWQAELQRARTQSDELARELQELRPETGRRGRFRR